jgi:uncharacterized protein with HEPN domain
MNAELRLVERLKHILEAALKVMTYVEGMDKASFFADERTQQAAVLNLLIIGEAVSSLLKKDAEFLDRHPEIEWQNMKGMRNRIAHAYFDLSINAVWDTIDTALPDLISRLPAIIALAKAEHRPC